MRYTDTDKLTWQTVYDDFARRHPNLSKEVLRWSATDIAEIEIWLKDNSVLRYSYLTHRAKFIKR